MCGIERMPNKFHYVPVIFIILLQGCVPLPPQKYYYMSINEFPGIEVLKYGTHSYEPLFFHDPMPTEYKLRRNAYILYIDVGVSGAIGSSLNIYSVSHNGSSLTIKPITITRNCGGFHRNYSGRKYYLQHPNAVTYVWGKYGEYCDPTNGDIIRNYEEIVFDVVDEEGNVLGSESLSYDLIRNGVYITYDAL